MKNRTDIAEVSSRLAQRAEDVCVLLLPAGKKHGNTFEVGSIYGEEGKTLKVTLSGTYQGQWQDWNGSEHKGDMLDLWAAVKNIALPEALREAKQYLGIYEPEMPEKSYAKPEGVKPEIAENGKAMQWFTTQRMLEPQIVNRFKVQADPAAKAIVFPCFSPQGELVNRSYRTLEAKKKVWQDKGAAPCLFGWHALSDTAYAKREVLICEGQIDAMTWTQWGVDALSIPNGSGKTWLEFEWANLEVFTTIFLSFDGDEAGKKNLEEVMTRLGKHRCRIVKLPHKDANECLKKGMTAEQARALVESSEYATITHLVDAAHYTDKVIEQFFPTTEALGFSIPQTVHRNKDLTFRFRDSEVTLWTGESGSGKSTLLNLAMPMLASATKKPALIISPEMRPEKVLRRVILGAGMSVSNAEDVRSAIGVLKRKLLFCSKPGSLSVKELFEILNYAYARYGISHATLDSLMCIEGMEEDYPAQSQLILDILGFARETGVHFHLVAHPRKTNATPNANDIKGSSNLRNRPDNILLLVRNLEKEEKAEAGENVDGMPDAYLKVMKDREEGTLRSFQLTYSKSLYRFTAFAP